jgi:hypothetical protein
LDPRVLEAPGDVAPSTHEERLTGEVVPEHVSVELLAQVVLRPFSPEFKAEAVRLCKVGERSIGPIARDLDRTETALRS